MSVRVDFAAESVPAVRSRLQSWMADVDAPARAIDDARLVASELIGNAIRHASPLADGMIRVAWAMTSDALELSISDGGSPTAPEVLDPFPHSTSGRGLAIVKALVDQWWVTQHGKERTVHAVIPLD